MKRSSSTSIISSWIVFLLVRIAFIRIFPYQPPGLWELHPLILGGLPSAAT